MVETSTVPCAIVGAARIPTSKSMMPRVFIEAEIRAALGTPTRVELSPQAKTKTLIYEARGLWLNIQLDQQLNFYNTVSDIGIMTTQGSPPPAASTPQTPPAPAGAAPQASPPPPVSAPRTSPPPAAPAPQITPPPPDPSRLYMVRVGPVSDRDRAAAIEKQLVAGGFIYTLYCSLPGHREAGMAATLRVRP